MKKADDLENAISSDGGSSTGMASVSASFQPQSDVKDLCRSETRAQNVCASSSGMVMDIVGKDQLPRRYESSTMDALTVGG
jgi:hypothetical protein